MLWVMNAILSLILFLDFCWRLWTAESRSGYFVRNYGWADLLASLPFPQLKVLRLFRLGRVYRLMREYGARNIIRSLVRERAGSALLSLLFVAILVLEFGSLWMLRLESASPDANITTASDAIWYVIVTISTVGYGDQYPVTNPGRLLGAVIIVLGVAIFGTLTGYLANLFLSPRRTSTPGTPRTRRRHREPRSTTGSPASPAPPSCATRVPSPRRSSRPRRPRSSPAEAHADATTGSEPEHGVQPAGRDRRGQLRVVLLVLVGVGDGEVGDGLVEGVLAAEVGRDGDPVAGARVGAGERPAAQPAVDGHAGRDHLLDGQRRLPVAQLADVEVAA